MSTYNRLTHHQRFTIATMNRNRFPQKEIATAIVISSSTVSCALRRNGMSWENYCGRERSQGEFPERQHPGYQEPRG